jgi:hypothetical protein
MGSWIEGYQKYDTTLSPNQGRIQDFCREGSTSRRGSRNLVRVSDNVLTEGCAAAGSPRKILKSRCSEMRFQANPDCTILPQNYIELLYVRHVEVCWTILRSEIKVNNVHKVFRANFFAIVHKFVEKKFGGWEQWGHDPQSPPLDPRLLMQMNAGGFPGRKDRNPALVWLVELP